MTEKKSNQIRYIICSDLRVGGTLLCDLLLSTAIAGKPIKLFDKPGGIDTKNVIWDKIDLKEFFENIFELTSTPNGVSGFKFRLTRIENLINVINKTEKYKNVSIENINSFFPKDLKYIWIVRKNKVRQAVSYVKVLQTKIRHPRIESKEKHPIVPIFNLEQIDMYVDEFKRREIAWGKFFKKNKICPLMLEYEDWVRDFRGTVVKVLDYLEIPVPDDLVVKTDLVRQSDVLSEEWVKRYHDEMTLKRKISKFYKYNLINPVYSLSFRLKEHFPAYKWFMGKVKK